MRGNDTLVILGIAYILGTGVSTCVRNFGGMLDHHYERQRTAIVERYSPKMENTQGTQSFPYFIGTDLESKCEAKR